MALAAILPMTVMAADAKASSGIKVKITAGGKVLTATFQDNATSRALTALFPLTVPMMDLYSRELVYRFTQPLPAEQKTTSGYDIGDIVYWAPRHSFVIMYAQNGERISDLQKVGRIDSGVEKLANVGNIPVLFELMPP
ncbi:hypothetical protein HS961_11375 [Comamonas piscis]|uniref:Cyclophilin-like domain-containing protein n=2 Tax=Comamonas piscis TaxID=1562974 RepID=A0A7G5EP11_9BURK|nr:hypothetical protein HS961_11375 [Comamonas piscis]